MCICMDVLLLKGAGKGMVDKRSEEQIEEKGPRYKCTFEGLSALYSGKKRESQNAL